MAATPTTEPEPRDTEEARPIEDSMMVFRSVQDPALTPSAKKLALKAAKIKLKLRKSTPAPVCKRNGRKRPVLSPFPEDKQLRKRIDFEEEGAPSPKGKKSLFQASPSTPPINGLEVGFMVKNQGDAVDVTEDNEEMRLVCYDSNMAEKKTPESGEVTGEEKTASMGLDNQRSTLDVFTDSNLGVGGEMVNLPNLDQETNPLLESGLESCLVGMAHGDKLILAVGDHTQTQPDNLLSLVQLDSADQLDVAAAQPLLAGGQPVQTNSSSMHGPEPLAAMDTSVLALEAPHHCFENVDVEMEVQGAGLGTGSVVVAPTGLGGAYVAPLDEFPPLGKGQFKKLRNRFEAGSMPRTDGSRFSGPGERGSGVSSGQSGSSGGIASAVGTETGPSAGLLSTEKLHAPGTRHGEDMPRQADTHAENSAAERAGVQGAMGKGNTMGPSGPRQEGHTNHGGHMNGPKTMADLLRDRPDPNSPQVFVPEKITNIGFASTSNGLPSIYFSGAEIQKLADSIGYAIVGKFSHSIPNAKQIQKTLDNVKFKCGFSWKYINAKHILVQFEDMADYARLLSGPKGTPVWYVDRHPMRVFKWTPDFDAYCESPIAAIWCNLIGLPIHLFDQSALFAIGKLLGTPIQVDRATADRSRLSFARICIEIDITKPPPEEIILDICGREIVQQIRWGKIPAYCHECKHVGHSSEVCYAAGKIARPEKRNYNTIPPKQTHQNGHGANGHQDQAQQTQNENEKGRQWKTKGKGGSKAGGGGF